MIVGITENNKKVFCGKRIFDMRSTNGIDLDFIKPWLEDNDIVPDVIGFVQAAIDDGWKHKTIINNLIYGLSIPAAQIKIIESMLDRLRSGPDRNSLDIEEENINNDQ